MMTVGSLFAGIGGFDLGLERAGMEVRWQVEIDPFCRKVLAKHWPDVKRYEDVREVGAHNLEPVELICGGFPCQDISNAGKRAGITGARSGLWGEYGRIIRELRPSYVIVENVSALLTRGIDVVLGDLAESGYDAEWDVLSATAVGAPHRRERVWIVAYPQGQRQRPRLQGRGIKLEGAGPRRDSAQCSEEGSLAYPNQQGLEGSGGEWLLQEREAPVGYTGQGSAALPRENVGNPNNISSEGNRPIREQEPAARCETGEPSRPGGDPHQHWTVEPDVGRVAHGVPRRVDRLRGLGNAVVPQVVEWIGQRILAVDNSFQVNRESDDTMSLAR
jgi:DNA (cytosine-5)-methyltransferase 1